MTISFGLQSRPTLIKFFTLNYIEFRPKWYNEAVVNARRLNRRRSERRWKKTRPDADYQKYLDAKRAATDSIALEKSRFHAEKFDNCKC